MCNNVDPINPPDRGVFQRLPGWLAAACCIAVPYAVAPSEVAAQQVYGQVRGWTINLLDFGPGPACTMFRTKADNMLLLQRRGGQWQIGVRSKRAPGTATTINLEVDKSPAAWNAVVAPGGYAVVPITPQWVHGIGQAQTIQAATDGAPLRPVSAVGTAAAITKVEECDGGPLPPATQQSTGSLAPKSAGPSKKPGSFNLYGKVKNWEIYSDTPGCTAQNPGEVIVGLNTPPIGGWELQIEDLEGHANDTEFPAEIVVDGRKFKDTFFAVNGQFYGSLELDLRKALADGKTANFIWGDYNLPLDLTGITAAFLKVEECWHKLTGYDPTISSRAGTYAFR